MEETYLPAKELYQAWAGTYDGSPNPLIEAESKALAGIIGDVAGKKVLDLGCGTGRYAIHLARSGATVTGVDFSDEMLAIARNNAAGLDITFANAEVHAVPLHDEFDLVLCSLVLSHVADLRPVMQEMARLTRPGGRILITDLNTRHWLRKKKQIRKFGSFATDAFRHTLSDYRSATRAAGLVLTKLAGIRFDDAIVAKFPWFFYLKYIAVAYMFDLRKPAAQEMPG